MPLIAGELDAQANFLDPDCMAKYIDDQMDPIPGNLSGVDRLALVRGRRQFFIQLSEGIINYLKVHAGDSFVVGAGSSASPGTVSIR